MDQIYAVSMGRIKAMSPNFLGPERYSALLSSRDVTEAGKLLESTWYGPDIVQALGAHRGVEAYLIGINRKFVALNRFGFLSAPFAGRPVVGAYLRRWDVENIGLILAAKAYGRVGSDVESHFVTDRESPSSPGAGLLGLDDLRGLLALPSVEAVANQLVKFGYGSVLLQSLEAFQRRPDVFFLVQVLERQYFEELRRSARFFQGDEWVVREFVASEIDRRNALTLLKGVELHLGAEDLEPRLLEGGSIGPKTFLDLLGQPGVAEAAGALSKSIPLGDALAGFEEEHSLVPFELALRRWVLRRALALARQYPLSLAGLFGFLLRAEAERDDLRRILYGKVYGFPPERITRDLLAASAS